ncbi:hypothetical protein [Stutzerimonas xanthomarina]|uniref:hypothetical protein n=1 Tax=Stutzerimonas xanthomarina TaxID=271420 RepID=UPI003AA8E9EC
MSEKNVEIGVVASIIAIVGFGYFLKFTELVAGFDTVLYSWILLSIVFIGRFQAFSSVIFVCLFCLISLVYYWLNIVLFGSSSFVLSNILMFLVLGGLVSIFLSRSVSKYEYILSLLLNFSFVALVVVSLLFIVLSGNHFSFYLGAQYKNSYLILSDILALFTICFFVSSQSWVKFLVGAFGGVLVMLLGSRSTMVFMFVSLAIYFPFLFHVSRSREKIIYTTLLLLSLCAVSWYVYENIEMFYRFQSLLSLREDSSFLARQELKEFFFRSLTGRPSCFLFGCGTKVQGEYVHNYLSIWQFFGLPLFFGTVLFLCSVSLCLVKYTSRYQRVVPLFVFCALQLFFSRSIVGIVYPVLIGVSSYVFFSQYRYRLVREKNN